MRTYIFNVSDSPASFCNTRVTVYRIKRNQPHLVGTSDRDTASWYGAHGEAVHLIHEYDSLPYANKLDGSVNRYELRGELLPAEKYDDFGHKRDAVRLFEVSGALQ